MDQLLEFTGNHPLLMTAAFVLFAAAMMAETKARAAQGLMLGPADATRAGNRGLIIDLRPPEVFALGHLAGARNIALTDLASAAKDIAKYRDRPVVVCCDNGRDSLRAVRALRTSGFEQVFGLKDGISGWRRENLPLVDAPAQS
jgi:rhodanese-related sulfurtransferase